MKIAFLSTSIIPSRTANSIHTMKMCQALGKNEHEVLLLVPDRPMQEPDVENVFQFYLREEPAFALKKMNWPPLKGQHFIFAHKVALAAKQWRADLVYGPSLYGCFFGALYGLPTIYEAHNSMDHCQVIKRWLFKRMIGMKAFRRLVVISHALKKYYLERYNISAEFIHVAPEGADAPSQHQIPSSDRSGRMQVGYIGHLYRGRGIEQIAELAARCKDIDFHLIGGLERDIAYWQKRLAPLSNVNLHGFIQPVNLEKYHQMVDVFLAPYQKDASPFSLSSKNKVITANWMSPMKIFDYMAAKKPIIASDLPVIREVLNESNAILVTPTDIASWAEAVHKLKDPNMRLRLARRAEKDLIEKYTWSQRAKTVIGDVNKA